MDSINITSCGLVGSKGPKKYDLPAESMSPISSLSEFVSAFEFKIMFSPEISVLSKLKGLGVGEWTDLRVGELPFFL